jgi:MFS family permease
LVAFFLYSFRIALHSLAAVRVLGMRKRAVRRSLPTLKVFVDWLLSPFPFVFSERCFNSLLVFLSFATSICTFRFWLRVIEMMVNALVGIQMEHHWWRVDALRIFCVGHDGAGVNRKSWRIANVQYLQNRQTMEKVNTNRLFVASCLALLVTAITFAIRAQIEGVFTDDYGLTKEQVGRAFGPAFWGFAVAMFAGGYFIDIVKTRTIVWAAFAMHFVGIVLLLFSKDFTSLFIANVFIGFGNGSVEAACNPLVVTIYPEKKTKMLNRFHVWFPGGIVVGSLLAYFIMDTIGLSWQVLVGVLFVPLIAYGYLFLGQKIPETERVTLGVSYKEMMRNVGAPVTITLTVIFMIMVATVPSVATVVTSSPTLPLILVAIIAVLITIEGRVMNKITLLFPFIFFCMLLTASTELGTTQWINALMESNGIGPMIILAVVTGIMAVGRYFAGGLIHRLNPTGVLLGSAIIAFAGLILLSIATGPVATVLSAAVFAVGVCYFWPTMIGVASEYVPKSGALGMSILGGAGFVATSMVLPIMGKSIETAGAQATLRSMSVLPAILIVAFIILQIIVRSRKTKESQG